ncbi:MAG: CoA pyrophosphatase [Atopobiaceae bacterium]|nr:CoA pyrophosphatase [Atopobiaceae bacterium]
MRTDNPKMNSAKHKQVFESPTAGQITSSLEYAQSHRAWRDAAILIPLVPTEHGFDIVFELRSQKLVSQPGEVSLPGGHLEDGETALEAAIRETCEELLVSTEQLLYLGELGEFGGGSARSVRVFVAVLNNYEGSFDPEEVERSFVIPLSWFMEHAPQFWTVPLTHEFPDDFPFDLIPGGRDYPWGKRSHDVPFYLDTDPLIWGLTARILHQFCEVLRNDPNALS